MKKITKKSKNKAKTKVLKKRASKVLVSNKYGVQPIGDRVILRPLSPLEAGVKTLSGIIIPDTVSKEKPEQGEVIAVGEGRWEHGVRIPLSVKVGDKVVFSKYGYDEVKVGGVEYYILREENILAVIKG